MKQFAAIFLIAAGFASTANAQSFLDEVRKKKSGEGTVTVNQSTAIDELVNNAKLTITTPQSTDTHTATPGKQTTNGAVPNQQAHHDKDSAGRTPERQPVNANKDSADERFNVRKPSATDTETGTELPSVNTAKKVMRNSRKVTGYRVQAFSGGNSRADRQKAERIGNAIKMRFPDLPVYVHFYSPRWICRVGNFRTYQDAEAVLKEIKGMGYQQACIVKGKISIGY